jgi:hypothetical protein
MLFLFLKKIYFLPFISFKYTETSSLHNLYLFLNNIFTLIYAFFETHVFFIKRILLNIYFSYDK